jgi:hypothetical protein
MLETTKQFFLKEAFFKINYIVLEGSLLSASLYLDFLKIVLSGYN